MWARCKGGHDRANNQDEIDESEQDRAAYRMSYAGIHYTYLGVKWGKWEWSAGEGRLSGKSCELRGISHRKGHMTKTDRDREGNAMLRGELRGKGVDI